MRIKLRLTSISNCLYVCLVLLFASTSRVTYADTAVVAVASNFAPTMNALVASFEARFPHTISIVRGSTGKHYAQITNGAPYHLFLAADAKRPTLLIEQGFGKSKCSVTYAIGRLALIGASSLEVLSKPKLFERLAIANPKLAPYGLAARQVLQVSNHWENVRHKVVRGENISQTLQLVLSGNAQLGLVSYAQLQTLATPPAHFLLPETLHEPIMQQALLLRDNKAAEDFLEFLLSVSAKQIILAHGYEVADDAR